MAQELDGLWFSTSRMNIQQRTESTDLVDGEFITKELDHIQIDTFYFNAEAILNFFPDNNFEIKGLGNSIGTGTYSLSNDTIVAQVDTLQLKLVQLEDHLLLIDLDSGWQYNQFIFERLKPVPSEPLVIPDFRSNSYWIVESDTSSINHGLEIIFLDSASLIITQFQNDYTYTSRGDYKTDSYLNNLYLYFINRNTLDDRMFRLFDWNQDSYKAQCYELAFGEEPPEKQSFEFRTITLPSNKTLKQIKKRLTGSWSLTEGEIPFEPELSDFDQVEKGFLQFQIDDSSFEIYYGGEFTNENDRQRLSEKLEGNWKLGRTGKFLELQLTSGETRYLTIAEISKRSFAFNMELKTPDSEGVYRSQTIKLERR